jgi:hypothetical protein
MSMQLWKVILKPTQFKHKVTPEMMGFLSNFKNDNGEINLNLSDLEENLGERETGIDSELQPLIDFLRKDLADGEYHSYQIA